LGGFGGLFRGDSGGFRGRGGEEAFSMIGQTSSGVLRLVQADRTLPPLILLLYPRLTVSLPGVVRVPMKGIVVHGESRETTQDASGKP